MVPFQKSILLKMNLFSFWQFELVCERWDVYPAAPQSGSSFSTLSSFSTSLSFPKLPISFIHHLPNIFSLCFVKKVNCGNLDSRLFVQLWEFNQPSVLSRKTCWTWRATLSEFYRDSRKKDSRKNSKNGYKFRITRNTCRTLHGSFQVQNSTGGWQDLAGKEERKSIFSFFISFF